MGAIISITNESEVTINVALKQVGVLYWKNGLEPGETVNWNLGRVWVTVEAIVDDERDGRSQYRELDRILPIILTTGGVLAVASGAVVAAGPAVFGAAGGAAVAAYGAAETAGAAAIAGAAEVIQGTGTAAATAGGAAAGAAAGAFTQKVASIFGKKAANTAVDIATDATVGAVYREYKGERRRQLTKVKKYGVFAGDNPHFIVKGNSKALSIDLKTPEPG